MDQKEREIVVNMRPQSCLNIKWMVVTQKTQSSIPAALHPNPNNNCLVNKTVQGFRIRKAASQISVWVKF